MASRAVHPKPGTNPFTAAPSPAGWSDRQADWLTPESVGARLDWAQSMGLRFQRGVDVAKLADSLFGPLLSSETREALRSSSFPLALLLASPEFQWADMWTRRQLLFGSAARALSTDELCQKPTCGQQLRPRSFTRWARRSGGRGASWRSRLRTCPRNPSDLALRDHRPRWLFRSHPRSGHSSAFGSAKSFFSCMRWLLPTEVVPTSMPRRSSKMELGPFTTMTAAG